MQNAKNPSAPETPQLGPQGDVKPGNEIASFECKNCRDPCTLAINYGDVGTPKRHRMSPGFCPLGNKRPNWVEAPAQTAPGGLCHLQTSTPFHSSPPATVQSRASTDGYCAECISLAHFTLAQSISQYYDCKNPVGEGQCCCACGAHGERKRHSAPPQYSSHMPCFICGAEIYYFPAHNDYFEQDGSTHHHIEPDEDTQGAGIDPIDDIFTEGVDD